MTFRFAERIIKDGITTGFTIAVEAQSLGQALQTLKHQVGGWQVSRQSATVLVEHEGGRRLWALVPGEAK